MRQRIAYGSKRIVSRFADACGSLKAAMRDRSRLAALELQLRGAKRMEEAHRVESENQTRAHVNARAEAEAAKARLSELERERITFLHLEGETDVDRDKDLIQIGLGETEVTNRDAVTPKAQHIDALSAIHRIALHQGVASQTTRRFRREIVYYLLDNAARGPIIEVGTLYGGMTAIFGYIGIVTGRDVFAIDAIQDRLDRTKSTVNGLRLGERVQYFCGDLERFLQGYRSELYSRPDLIFLDSSHDYDTTLAEFRAIHREPKALPRAIAMHDFNYRMAHQLGWLEQLDQRNPVAVDIAVRDFYARETSVPIFKRIGEFCGDGIVSDQRQGSVGDYIATYGTEGMIAIYP